jgi:1-acyl-sn-glycerol-3-phosphate acyltransferase
VLRGIWTLGVLIVATAVLAPIAAVGSLVVPRSNVLIHAGRLWSRLLLAACGARVRYHHVERLSAHPACIFIANHQSMVDIWAMLRVLPPATRFVAKRELFRIPVFGWALAASGCIPLDRDDRTRAIRSLRGAAERIRGGRPVVLYPEGTRSRDGRLQPFKKGAFHLAVEAGVPIVPVAITGSFRVLPPGSLRARPGPVEVWVEPPVDVASYLPRDHDGLRAAVQSVFARRFGQAELVLDERPVPAPAPAP